MMLYHNLKTGQTFEAFGNLMQVAHEALRPKDGGMFFQGGRISDIHDPLNALEVMDFSQFPGELAFQFDELHGVNAQAAFLKPYALGNPIGRGTTRMEAARDLWCKLRAEHGATMP